MTYVILYTSVGLDYFVLQMFFLIQKYNFDAILARVFWSAICSLHICMRNGCSKPFHYYKLHSKKKGDGLISVRDLFCLLEFLQWKWFRIIKLAKDLKCSYSFFTKPLGKFKNNTYKCINHKSFKLWQSKTTKEWLCKKKEIVAAQQLCKFMQKISRTRNLGRRCKGKRKH